MTGLLAFFAGIGLPPVLVACGLVSARLALGSLDRGRQAAGATWLVYAAYNALWAVIAFGPSYFSRSPEIEV